jgi:hypothetical protein
MTPDGGTGAALGVTGAEGADSGLEPLPLNAATVTVYVTPFVSPVITQSRAPPGSTNHVQELPPGEAVAVY